MNFYKTILQIFFLYVTSQYENSRVINIKYKKIFL